VAITALVIGVSHMTRPADWAEAFRQLHGLGRAGAFLNGILSLTVGAIIVAGHPSWGWPGALITAFGWLQVAKGLVCLIAPDKALRSMERGGRSPRGFVAAGVVLLALGGWSCYCIWHETLRSITEQREAKVELCRPPSLSRGAIARVPGDGLPPTRLLHHRIP
jgi:uncharacterized protein YjeT (DUF2065 family)